MLRFTYIANNLLKKRIIAKIISKTSFIKLNVASASYKSVFDSRMPLKKQFPCQYNICTFPNWKLQIANV